MAIWELDSEMLKKIERLHRICLTLNSMKTQLTASYQMNDERIQINLTKHDYDFTIFSFQRRYIQLTYADLDEAAEEIQKWMKYKW